MGTFSIDILVHRVIDNKKYELGFKVQLIPEQDFTVLDFIKRVIHCCQLQINEEQAQLFHNQFIIPKKSSAYSIKSQNVYHLEIVDDQSNKKKNKRESKSIKKFLKWGVIKNDHQTQKIERKLIEYISQENDCGSYQEQQQQQNNQSTPVQESVQKKIQKKIKNSHNNKISNKKIKPNESILNNKLSNLKNTKKKAISSQFSPSSSSQQSSSSSQQSQLSASSQSSGLKQLRNSIMKNMKTKSPTYLNNKSNANIPNNNANVNTNKNYIIATNKINNNKNHQNKNAFHKVQLQKNMPSSYTQQFKNVVTALKPVITYGTKQPKKNINQPSLFQTMKSHSQSNSLQSSARMKPFNQNNSEIQSSSQSQKAIQVKKPQINLHSNLIPPSIKKNNQKINNFSFKTSLMKNQNKIPTKNFKNHKQHQWIPLNQKIIKQYSESHNQKYLIQQKNQIRFKTIQLDQQKFTPVMSDWIEGIVVSANQQQIKLQKAKKGAQFLGQYTIAFHNMSQPGINRLYLNQQQIQALNAKEQAQNLDKKLLNVSNKQQNNSQINQKSINTKQKGQNQNYGQSIQDFICGQVNYYFSDKNYSTDLFMQMHANKNPQKYIDIEFMLNFPKIKKSLTDKNKLMKYLYQDQRKLKRNYELDQERNMIRKKRIQTQKQFQENKSKMQNAIKQNEEKLKEDQMKAQVML